LIPPQAKASSRPPVHIQDLSGNEVSSIGNEESNGGSHVGWPPDAPPWHNCIPKLRRVPWDREIAGHFDDSRSNRIHPDTLRSQLNRQFMCEGIDSSLRRSINWVSRKTTEAMYRGNIDDATPNSPQQERQGILRTEKVTSLLKKALSSLQKNA